MICTRSYLNVLLKLLKIRIRHIHDLEWEQCFCACDGTIYTGCNIENSSFSLTNCAERTAFFKAIPEGKKEFEAIAIAGGHDNMSEPCYPCGSCRQVMTEFCHNYFKIILSDKILTLNEILPYGFSLN